MKIPFGVGICLLAIGYWLSVVPASAHPGHGPTEVPPAHYLANPDHLGLVLAASVIAFAIVRLLKSLWLQCRRADLPSSVPPICHRQHAANFNAPEQSERSQVEILRYSRLEICATVPAP